MIILKILSSIIIIFLTLVFILLIKDMAKFIKKMDTLLEKIIWSIIILGTFALYLLGVYCFIRFMLL